MIAWRERSALDKLQYALATAGDDGVPERLRMWAVLCWQGLLGVEAAQHWISATALTVPRPGNFASQSDRAAIGTIWHAVQRALEANQTTSTATLVRWNDELDTEVAALGLDEGVKKLAEALVAGIDDVPLDRKFEAGVAHAARHGTEMGQSLVGALTPPAAWHVMMKMGGALLDAHHKNQVVAQSTLRRWEKTAGTAYLNDSFRPAFLAFTKQGVRYDRD